MYIGKRILAYMFDYAVSIFLGMFVIAGMFYLLEGFLLVVENLGINSASIDTLLVEDLMSGELIPILLLSMWVIGWPSLFLGSCAHLFGASIGKLVFGLRIVDSQGNKPSFRLAFGRELLKILILFVPFLWLLPLIQLLIQGNTFYDQLFRIAVRGKPKLTAVQKKYQTYYGNRL